MYNVSFLQKRAIGMRAIDRLAVWLLVSATLPLQSSNAASAQPTTRGPITPSEGKTELLWQRGAPGAVGDTEKDRPYISVYLPSHEASTGAAVVVCPGGGYAHLAVDHEGRVPARFLNSLGAAAFVLHYRIAPRYHHPAPLQDAQRALRMVRARSNEWHIDANRIGIWGFSAGGHLASTAATHFDRGQADALDPIERVSSRPDFAILSYAVITMEPPYTHMGSRKNLLGPNPAAELVESLSNEKQVRTDTPPTFLFHTTADSAVPSENSVKFYEALRKAGVPAELHIYEVGRHGVGLAPNDPILSTWTDRLAAWLRQRKILPGRVSEGVEIINDIPYREGDSKPWRLDLAMRKSTSGKPRPAIVVIHGGGWLEGDKSSFASRQYGVPGNIVEFAEQGFVAATINYRLSGEAPFPAALEDCRCAVRWLRAHANDYNLDPNRIGAFGNSAGGHLAMLLGMAAAAPNGDSPDRSSAVQAIVSDSGPIDLSYQFEHGPLREAIRKLMGGAPDEKLADAYRRASPMHSIQANVPPMLLIYGVEDEQVPIATADQFVAALGRAGVKDTSYLRLAGVGHCPYSRVRVPSVHSAVNEFFTRTLMQTTEASR
jgi:acetyl esterase/lipase